MNQNEIVNKAIQMSNKPLTVSDLNQAIRDFNKREERRLRRLLRTGCRKFLKDFFIPAVNEVYYFHETYQTHGNGD